MGGIKKCPTIGIPLYRYTVALYFMTSSVLDDSSKNSKNSSKVKDSGRIYTLQAVQQRHDNTACSATLSEVNCRKVCTKPNNFMP